LHYENRIGLTVDLAGTFLPGGPPLAGDPMADAAAFVLDPALSNRRFIDDFRHASLASYTIRAGYTTRF
jgi:hypothetical protein